MNPEPETQPLTRVDPSKGIGSKSKPLEPCSPSSGLRLPGRDRRTLDAALRGAAAHASKGANEAELGAVDSQAAVLVVVVAAAVARLVTSVTLYMTQASQD